MDFSLNEQLERLQEILIATRSKSFWQSLPIIDETKDEDVVDIQDNDLPGLRHLRMSIQKEIETIETHLNLDADKPLSTNSPYYLSLWDEILSARRPILALWKTFDTASVDDPVNGKHSTSTKVKVDIIANNGHDWIRVNTTKESRLSAEFRGIEAFGYESSDEENEGAHESRSTSTKEKGGTCTTDWTYTIDLSASDSSNLCLRGGDLSPAPTPQFDLPNNINLDLSLLIALVTDITHAVLPTTPEDSYKRFQPQTDRSWKRRFEKDPLSTQDADEHCRALAEQTIDEMNRGLIERIHGRIANLAHVQFWTTAEAKERFLAIIDKIGGADEVTRAHALFSTNPNASEDFWRNSRIQPGGRPPFIPINIFPSEKPDISISPHIQDKTFNQMLITTCITILSRPVRPDAKNDDPNKKLPAPTRFAARLSAHTIQSLLWGASQKMVTLTSNKTSVRLVLREMRGFALPSAVNDAHESVDSVEDSEGWSLWVMEPRSLAAVMRSDLRPPDFRGSYSLTRVIFGCGLVPSGSTNLHPTFTERDTPNDIDKAEAELMLNIKKATSPEETAPKQKHVRKCIVYTWDYHTSASIWTGLKVQPILADEVQTFKALITVHKVLQEGYPATLKDAQQQVGWFETCARTVANDGYGQLIRAYVAFILSKLRFHRHRPEFNGLFEYEEYISLKGIDNPDEGYGTISDLMDLQDQIEQLQKLIFAHFRHSANNECRISALVPLVKESYNIYRFITSMLRAMHRRTSDHEALEPLRSRYNSQHHALRKFYFECSNLKYLTGLINVPKLGQEPPSLLDNGQTPDLPKRPTEKTKSPTPPPTAPSPDAAMIREQAAMLKEYEDKQKALEAQRLADEQRRREAEMQQQREIEEMQRQQAERERIAQEMLRAQQVQQINDQATQHLLLDDIANVY
ncbi:3573_t:CDS:10, partial [Acaulospora colombiana]